MKLINIVLPSKKIDNNGSIKNKILNEINKRYPFFKWHKNDEEPEFSVEYAGPNDILVFGRPDFHFSALNKRFWKPSNQKELLDYTKLIVEQSNRKYDAESELDIAMYQLKKYAKAIKDYYEDPGYDFTFMGKPCRIYDNFIQIGDVIIPFENYTTIFDHIRNEEKKNEITATLTCISKDFVRKLVA